jgi:hypothetical protein
MIKDVMVRLDGTSADDVRPAVVNQIAEIFDSYITGLFFNVLPSLVPDGFNGAGANQTAKWLDIAREAGDAIEAAVFQRLAQLEHPANLRRFDVIGGDDICDTALQMARAADTFVALRPNGRSSEPKGLVENLLFGAGRQLFLVPDDLKASRVRQRRGGVEWKPGVGARSCRVIPLSASCAKGRRPRRGEPASTAAEGLMGNDAVHHLRHQISCRRPRRRNCRCAHRRMPQARCKPAGDGELWPLTSA